MQSPAEIARLFRDLSRAERTAWIEEAVRGTGRSRDYFYRLARQGGWESGRKRRADSGEARSGITETELLQIARIKLDSTRANGKQIAGTARAASLLVGRPIQAVSDAPSVGTFNRHLRRLGLDRKSLRRTRVFERVNKTTGEVRTYVSQANNILTSDHPNRQHHVDTSICVLWHFGPGSKYQLGGGRENFERLLYKNKPDKAVKMLKQGLKIIRYVLVDHCSNSIYWRYYESGGENAADMGDFLYHAWVRKPWMEFHGVPDVVVADSGSGMNNRLIETLFDRLDVRWVPTLPGNKEANGAVEGAQNIVECYFESLLRFGDVPDLATLNSMAEKACAYLNKCEVHTRLGKPRSAVWSMLDSENLRELAMTWPQFQRLMDLPATRKVSLRGTVEFDGMTYLVREPSLLGETVTVHHSPYLCPAIVVSHAASGYRASLEPLPVNRFGRLVTGANMANGTFDRIPETDTVKNVRKALGTPVDVDPHALLDNMAERAAGRDFLGSHKTGTPLGARCTVPENEPFATRVDAKAWLVEKYGSLDPERMFRLTELLPENAVTVEQAEEAFRRLAAETHHPDKEQLYA